MKKLILLIASVFITNFSFAQWAGSTNTTGDINRSGNVGIGTTTPSELLDVNGTIQSSKHNIFHIDNTTALDIRQNGSNRRLYYNASSSSQTLGLLDTNNVSRFFVNAKKNTSETYMVLKKPDGGEIIKMGYLGTSNIGSYIHMPNTNSRVVIAGLGNYLINEGHKLVVKNGSAKIEGNIITNENIGIGTSSFTDGNDSYRLSVDGAVRAHEVKVYTTWADFVFYENYNLPTLEDVEQFILKNGHLKDIPSEKEVEENGIQLGEMNKLLLQKIEELTLYTIEQEKRLKALEVLLAKKQ